MQRVRIIVSKCLVTDWETEKHENGDTVIDLDGLIDECLAHGDILDTNYEVFGKFEN